MNRSASPGRQGLSVKLLITVSLLCCCIFFVGCVTRVEAFPPSEKSIPAASPGQGNVYARDMEIGVWSAGHRYITMGQYNGHPLVWRVLEVYESDGADGNQPGHKTAFLLADELLKDKKGEVETRAFNSGDNNDWPGSDLYAFLNGESPEQFLHKDNFSAREKQSVITAKYTTSVYNYEYPPTLDGSVSHSSRVFLLNMEEAENIPSYFSSYTERAIGDNWLSNWWLRSPGSTTIVCEATVGNNGRASSEGDATKWWLGVRPAIKVDLSSEICATLTVRQEPDSNFLAKQRDMAPGFWANNPRYITFGQYNGQPLLWRVLEVSVSDGKDGNQPGHKTALLLTEQVLKKADGTADKWIYCSSDDREWENSDIYKSLNGEFLQEKNFSVREKSAIITSNYAVEARDWQGIKTGKEKSFNSQVFLLSIEEAEEPNYFPTDTARSSSNGDWWLRDFNLVDSGGQVDLGNGYPDSLYAIRPAIKVDLSSEIFSPALTGCEPDPDFLIKWQAALAAPGMSIGTWSSDPRFLTFGQYKGRPMRWRVLDVYMSDGKDGNQLGNKSALLVTDELLKNADGSIELWPYTLREEAGGGWGGRWLGSNVYAFLNGEGDGQFLHSANFSAKEREAVFISVYGTTAQYNWWRSSSMQSSAVFLLSFEEAMDNDYFADSSARSASDNWWLRSPHRDDVGAWVWYVGKGGGAGAVDVHSERDLERWEEEGKKEWLEEIGYTFGLRPALRVNLSSPYFTSMPWPE